MDKFFVRWRGKISGPHSKGELVQMAKGGQLTQHHAISVDMALWQPASEIKFLFEREVPPMPSTVESIPPPSVAVAPASGPTLVSAPSEIPRQQPQKRKETTHSSDRTPLVLAVAALIIAVAALLVALFQNSFGKGLSAYDFSSSAEAAARSTFLITANGDVRANFDLNNFRFGDPKENLSTLEINRVADFGEKKIVFVSFMSGIVKKKIYLCFERNTSLKMWVPTFVHPSQIMEKNEQLAKDMDEWKEDPS